MVKVRNLVVWRPEELTVSFRATLPCILLFYAQILGRDSNGWKTRKLRLCCSTSDHSVSLFVCIKMWCLSTLVWSLSPPYSLLHTVCLLCVKRRTLCHSQPRCWRGVDTEMGPGSSECRAEKWCRRFHDPGLKRTGRGSAAASSSPRTEACCWPADSSGLVNNKVTCSLSI